MYFWILGALQIILALRVVLRLARNAGGVRIEAAAAPRSERVSIIVPVLNETARIKDCLECLIAQPEVLAEILVVDGGSSDDTQSIVERYGSRDRRVRLIDASPVPCNWTGKAWGLYVGLEKTDPRSNWVLCIDADVRCSPLLVSSLLAHAEGTGISTFSVATRQQFSSLAEALLHPSLLTTLVYRFVMGIAKGYEWRPWTYWFSPLLDLPVALRLITSALRRRQVWRGRVYVRRAGGTFEPLDKSET